MKTLLSALVFLFLALPTIAQDAPEAAPIAAQVQVYFSPKGGCTDAAVKEINVAKSEIHVQAYSFTSKPIAKALLEAHKRGVKVQIIGMLN